MKVFQRLAHAFKAEGVDATFGMMGDGPCAGFDVEACDACLTDCFDSSGIAGDAVCWPLFEAASACESDAGCTEIDDEAAYDACITDNCCAEFTAALR